MSFLVVYISLMILPGALLASYCGVKVCRMCLAVAFSFSILVLTFALAHIASLKVEGISYLLAMVYLAIVVEVVRRRAKLNAWFEQCSFVDKVYLIPVVTFSIIIFYIFWAGPYVEVPADAWRHIAQINDEYVRIGKGELALLQSPRQLLSDDFSDWYAIIAYFLNITGHEVRSGLPLISAANTILFCIGIYSFSLFIFNDMVDSKYTLHCVAAMTVVFFFVVFGISVFSYVRYYVYGPAILNYVLYLSVVACMVQFIRDIVPAYRYVIVTLILTIVVSITHQQEVIFIASMLGTIVLVEAVRTYFDHRSREDSIDFKEKARSYRIYSMLALLLLAYVGIHAFSYFNLPKKDPTAHGLLADIRNFLPFLQNMYVLRPTYQFYQVVTVWGIFVYILFVYKFNKFTQNPYFVAGMITPFITVFNPLFTDLFLRFAPPTVLYRINYVIPLPFLGGFFFVKGLENIARKPRFVNWLGALFVVLLLLVLTLPIRTTYFVSPFSKIYTLQPVEKENDYRLWEDLIQFLRTRKNTGIITDSVTGYVINGLTSHHYPGVKFYINNWRDWLRVSEESYVIEDFEDRRGWFVIVNRRNGRLSEVGRYGGHWPENIMRVSEQYSDAFISFIIRHPGKFERIWNRESIDVYVVREDF